MFIDEMEEEREEVVVPEFTQITLPNVKLKDFKPRRFNIIDSAVLKARQEIMAQEDANIFAAIDKATFIINKKIYVCA